MTTAHDHAGAVCFMCNNGDEHEAGNRIQAAILRDFLTQHDPDLPLWYMSFIDPDVADTIPLDRQVPGGPSWMGACIVPAPDAAAAAAAAHRLKCNPGGAISLLGPIGRDAVKPEYVGRLLTSQAEVDEAGV